MATAEEDNGEYSEEMPRSPLTLAAAASAAVPGADILGARELTSESTGRYDSAVVTTPAEIELLVRIPNTNDAAIELASDAVALHALTDGARKLLPFSVPHFVKFVSLANERAGVFTFLPGYQLEDADIPVGPGATTSIGQAIAAIHAMPASVVREAGLRERSARAVREEVRSLIDRTDRTSLAPQKLVERWQLALGDDALWQFEPTVTLGGAEAGSFVFGDGVVAGVADVPLVTGVRGWHGLSIGDPAVDLAWLNAVGDAGDFVREAYEVASARHPDAGIEARARLLSELALAKWLVYGVDTAQQDIVDDAQEMLAELAADPGLTPLHTAGSGDEWAAADALSASDEVLSRALVTDDVSATSMQTDAFDRDALANYLDDDEDVADAAEFDVSLGDDTQPITGARAVAEAGSQAASDENTDDLSETQRAAQAALQRWSKSSSE